jgi:hypothetical protein
MAFQVYKEVSVKERQTNRMGHVACGTDAPANGVNRFDPALGTAHYETVKSRYSSHRVGSLTTSLNEG